jgi:hypothetical protein
MNGMSRITKPSASTLIAALTGLIVGAAGTAASAAEPEKLVSIAVVTAPKVDGRGNDEAWRAAPGLDVVARRVLPPNVGTATGVSLRSVHTRTHVYVLVTWDDATKDDEAHKPWVWNAAKGAYSEGPEREDMCALAFEHTGNFTADMLSGEEGVWDVWQWKATRTNPQGFAMDRTHRFARQKPEWKANPHPAKQGGEIWIARPEDAGATVERKQPAPTGYQGERVPQYLLGAPSGSAADVRARGTWIAGRWTVEFERALDTGHADDTPFSLTRPYRMAVAVHDRTGDMDKASGLIELLLDETR